MTSTLEASTGTCRHPGHRRHHRRHVGRGGRQRGLHRRPAQRGATCWPPCRHWGRVPLEAEQVAQLDSKDMDAVATWQVLGARRVAQHLARPEVQGVVVTHGTDTLEETAWLLQQVLAPTKPVVLVTGHAPGHGHGVPTDRRTCWTRWPWRATPGAQGVLAVLAGQVHAAGAVRKVHTYRVRRVFARAMPGLAGRGGGGAASPLAGLARGHRAGPGRARHATCRTPGPGWRSWPAMPRRGPMRCARWWPQACSGLVVAGTGNGSVHQTHWQPALAQAAKRQGVACGAAAAAPMAGCWWQHRWPVASPAAALTPWQARLALMLQLLAAARGLRRWPAAPGRSRGERAHQRPMRPALMQPSA